MGDEFKNNGSWEKAWQQAFEGADHTPPKRVWQGLENSLMEQQLQRYKRKLFLYQWLAAASVMLLGLWAGWWMFFAQPQQTPMAGNNPGVPAGVSASVSASSFSNGTFLDDYLAQADALSAGFSVADQPLATAQASDAMLAQARAEATEAGSVAAAVSGSGERPLAAGRGAKPLPTNGPALNAQAQKNSAIAGTDVNRQTSPALLKPQAPESTETITSPALPAEPGLANEHIANEEMLHIVVLDPSLQSLAAELRLADGRVEREIRVVGISRKGAKKKHGFIPNGDLWLGASIASNFFSPNMTNNGGYGLFWAEQPPVVGKGEPAVYTANVSNWDEKERSLPSIDFNVEAAFRLNKRWMFQSSIQYGTYRVNTLTGSFRDPESQKSYPLYYTNFSNDRLQVASPGSRIAAPVDALNTYSFLSVPLSFSYILYEGNIGIALSTGMSSDFFMGGQIEDIGTGRLEKYRISAGDDSPFRKVHFNALMGVQLFYRAGPNHLITIEPTYKHAITDFHRNGTYFNSRPNQIGVAAGFRYILR